MAELTLKTGLEAMDVAAWLRRHPTFLKDFPDIAETLVIPRERGSAASLAGYQLELLRERQRELEARLADLVEIAGENEQRVVQVHSYTLTLLCATDLAACVRAIVAGLREDFHTEQVSLLLNGAHAALAGLPWVRDVPEGADKLPAFADFFPRGEPLCGRLAPPKLDALFGAAAPEVQSAALLKLGALGVLGIGSSDPNRFHPGIGTLFLKLIAEAASVALGRYV
ncbi:protein containing DUF484 [mine drainage metagenome]|uniref:Protein containing DUF484 n=3 Tax=mine drainage metagenome TaxID=410659 RepID=T1CFP2_9ZZZZ